MLEAIFIGLTGGHMKQYSSRAKSGKSEDRPTVETGGLSRRSVLALSAAVVAGAGLASFGSGAPEAAFADVLGPRLLHTSDELRRVGDQVRAGAQPWAAGWDRLLKNSHSHSSWSPRPVATVVRGGTGQNYTLLYNDIHAAYQNALRWRISGDEAYAAAASGILNTWSRTLVAVNGNADRFLAAGIYGFQFAVAADVLRGYAGFDMAATQDMLLRVFYPMNNQFLTQHNGALISNYWANWDLCNMNSVLAIGVVCDRPDLVDQAVDYFKFGGGNGSIKNAVPILHPGGLGQWQESGRDQGHTMMGIGQMGTFCEMAWNQGIDLYGYDDSRFLKGAEYVAMYNLGFDVPFDTYSWWTGQHGPLMSQTVISSDSRGQERPVWELVYNHYVNRRGLTVPYVEQFAAQVRAEGGGGDYGPNSGGYDQLGFGTLAFSLPAYVAPVVPVTDSAPKTPASESAAEVVKPSAAEPSTATPSSSAATPSSSAATSSSSAATPLPRPAAGSLESLASESTELTSAKAASDRAGILGGSAGVLAVGGAVGGALFLRSRKRDGEHRQH